MSTKKMSAGTNERHSTSASTAYIKRQVPLQGSKSVKAHSEPI
jgi:hypothetical protein